MLCTKLLRNPMMAEYQFEKSFGFFGVSRPFSLVTRCHGYCRLLMSHVNYYFPLLDDGTHNVCTSVCRVRLSL